MKNFFKYILGFIVLAGLFSWYKKLKEKVALSDEERALLKQSLIDRYNILYPKMERANSQLANLLRNETGYFTNYQATKWHNNVQPLKTELLQHPIQPFIDEEIRNATTSFLNNERIVFSLRDQFNSNFVSEELVAYEHLFSNIEGRQLDIQQRTAIVTDEDNNIVIAGAGSGKTTTIVGKVNYIIDKYKVDPSSIVLISFTNKSAATLSQRIQIPGAEVKTFHKFGKDIIAEVEGHQPSIFDQNQFRPFINRCFKELLKDEAYLSKITNYFANYLKEPKSRFDFEDQGQYIQYIKDNNFKTYKTIELETHGHQTFKQEIVKSIEECKIANFLLFNNLEYSYERRYEFDTATADYSQYKPDFTVIQNGRNVYIEHFGVLRNGDVPAFFAGPGITYQEAKDKYWEKIHWARATHAANNTLMIETYSYEMSDDILFDNLTQNLQKSGVILTPKTPEEMWEIISSSSKEDVESFVALFQTFITLMKSNNYSLNDLAKKNSESIDGFGKQRSKLFLEIIGPVFNRYQKHLQDLQEIDFSDMINLASDYVLNKKYKKEVKYIIIDEFQDISIGRFKLIESIKKSNPDCKSFCVGDDWQSIYRFAGSDIALFKEFEKYFGFTVKSKVETTYRFNEPLIGISSSFILKNTNQLTKALKGKSGDSLSNYTIKYSVGNDQTDSVAVEEIFKEISVSRKSSDIMILGRYGFDVNRIKNTDKIKVVIRAINLSNGEVIRERDYLHGQNQPLKDNEKIIVLYKSVENGQIARHEGEFLTVHKAKGLEAGVVIIINCNSGKHGFPSEMSDDNVLNMLLSEADQYENGEERRLFYVAMTRAKEQLYWVTDVANKSKFITELELKSPQNSTSKCPKCKSADIIVRKQGIAKNGNNYKFFGCSNFLYGCDYTKTDFYNN